MLKEEIADFLKEIAEKSKKEEQFSEEEMKNLFLLSLLEDQGNHD